MSAWATPGVKCVCLGLRSQADAERYGQNVPVSGAVYTVREVIERNGTVGLTLVEVRNAPYQWSNGLWEARWNINRFRPLITKSKEDDVALFRSILNALPVGESA